MKGARRWTNSSASVSTNAAWATALLVVASAAARLWRSRPAVVHVLWLLVLIKLVTPSLTRVGVPVLASAELRPVGAALSVDPRVGERALSPSARGSGKRVTEGRVSDLDQGAAEGERPADAPSANQDQDFNSPGRSSARAATGNERARTEPLAPVQRRSVEVAPGSWPWRPLVLLLWLAGVSAWCLLLARTSLRFRRLVRSARPAPAASRRNGPRRVAFRLGLHRVPTIGLVPAPRAADALGIVRRPAAADLARRALVSSGCVQQDAVLAHELAHLKRRDHWVRRLEAVVLGLYWWYPGAWWARRQLERAEEECCDAWVVWALPSAAGSYAEALVATAVFLSGLRQPLPWERVGRGVLIL